MQKKRDNEDIICGFIVFCHLVFADCLLYESKEYANEGVEAYRESCESYGGGGGEFSYSVSESSSNNATLAIL